MAREPKKIKVAPGSELARLLTQAASTPLLIEKDGELYRLDRIEKEPESIWKDYDPEKVKEALRKSAGALAGVDTDALLRDIHEARQQGTRGRTAR